MHGAQVRGVSVSSVRTAGQHLFYFVKCNCANILRRDQVEENSPSGFYNTQGRAWYYSNWNLFSFSATDKKWSNPIKWESGIRVLQSGIWDFGGPKRLLSPELFHQSGLLKPYPMHGSVFHTMICIIILCLYLFYFTWAWHWHWCAVVSSFNSRLDYNDRKLNSWIDPTLKFYAMIRSGFYINISPPWFHSAGMKSRKNRY